MIDSTRTSQEANTGLQISLKGELERPSGFKISVNLKQQLQGVTAVIGHSGSGKSSLMRCIAGFENNAAIHVNIDGRTWQSENIHLPAEHRPVSTVFQEARLFPHLSVLENLQFVVRRFPDAHKLDALNHAEQNFCLPIDEVIEALSLSNILEHSAKQLSGGQAQRVALARALLRPACLWILDEPLASLDAAARAEIAPYIQMLCRRHDVPVLYVTHNLEEVLQIAEACWLVDQGKVSTLEVGSELSQRFASHLAINEDIGGILECSWVAYHEKYGLSELKISGASLFIRGKVINEEGPEDLPDKIRIFLPARDVSISKSRVVDASLMNQLPAKIISIKDDTAQTRLISLESNKQLILARITAYSADQLELKVGQEVFALVKTVSLAKSERVASNG